MTNRPNVNSNGPGAEGNRQDEQKGGDVQALTEALRDAVAALGGIRSDNVPESVRAALSSLALQPVEPPTTGDVQALTEIRGYINTEPLAKLGAIRSEWVAALDRAIWNRVIAAPPPAAVPAQPSDSINDEATDRMLEAKDKRRSELLPAAGPAQPAELTGNPFVRAGRLREQREAAQPAESAADFEASEATTFMGLAPDVRRRMWCVVTTVEPADRAEPAPLTDAQIVAIRDEHLPNQGDSFDCIAFARAILATRSQP